MLGASGVCVRALSAVVVWRSAFLTSVSLCSSLSLYVCVWPCVQVRLAAEQGLSFAQCILGLECLSTRNRYPQETGVPKDDVAAAEWLAKAAAQGVASAPDVVDGEAAGGWGEVRARGFGGMNLPWCCACEQWLRDEHTGGGEA